MREQSKAWMNRRWADRKEISIVVGSSVKDTTKFAAETTTRGAET